MSVTLQYLIDKTLIELNMPQNAKVGQYDSGTGGAPIYTTAQVATQFINEAMADLARGYFPIFSAAALTLPMNTNSIPYSTILDSQGRLFWAVDDVQQNSNPLTQSGIQQLRQFQGTAFQDPGTPTYWFDNLGAIGFDKTPAGNVPITLTGYVVPLTLVNPTDTVDPAFITDDQTSYIYVFAAAEIAFKNIISPSLEEQFGPLMQRYNSAKAELSAGIALRDALTYERFMKYQPQSPSSGKSK